MQYDTDSQMAQESSEVSQKLASDWSQLFASLLATLDAQLDVRLVRTFLATMAVIMQFRNRAQGLLLSELGAYLLSPQHAPAGTKRISNLLRSSKWKGCAQFGPAKQSACVSSNRASSISWVGHLSW